MRRAYPRVVIIVSRDRPDLYAYLHAAFTGVQAVEVIADRRLPTPTRFEEDDPGQTRRRWQPDIYDELLLRGFAIKRLPSSDVGPDVASCALDRVLSTPERRPPEELRE
jgi:hypothetical protein